MSTSEAAVLEGPPTVACIGQHRDELAACLAAGATRLDLGAVDECDTAGVQLLLALLAELIGAHALSQ